MTDYTLLTRVRRIVGFQVSASNLADAFRYAREDAGDESFPWTYSDERHFKADENESEDFWRCDLHLTGADADGDDGIYTFDATLCETIAVPAPDAQRLIAGETV